MVLAADDCGVGIAPVEHGVECKLWCLGAAAGATQGVQVASLQLRVCSSPQADHNSPHPPSPSKSAAWENRPITCTRRKSM